MSDPEDLEQLGDEIVAFLQTLHERDWETGLDALCCGIAEVEGLTHKYNEERVTTLAKELLQAIRFHRKADKWGFN